MYEYKCTFLNKDLSYSGEDEDEDEGDFAESSSTGITLPSIHNAPVV